MPPGGRPREHPLHLGVPVVEGDPAAADGDAVEACGEEPDVVLEELIQRERVALLRQVGAAESSIQLGHELPDLVGCGRPARSSRPLRSVRLKADGPGGV